MGDGNHVKYPELASGIPIQASRNLADVLSPNSEHIVANQYSNSHQGHGSYVKSGKLSSTLVGIKRSAGLLSIYSYTKHPPKELTSIDSGV